MYSFLDMCSSNGNTNPRCEEAAEDLPGYTRPPVTPSLNSVYGKHRTHGGLTIAHVVPTTYRWPPIGKIPSRSKWPHVEANILSHRIDVITTPP